VTGYSIVSADSRDDALTMAKGCPILPSGGSVVVIELLEVRSPGFGALGYDPRPEPPCQIRLRSASQATNQSA